MSEVSAAAVVGKNTEGLVRGSFAKLKSLREKHEHRHDPKPGSLIVDRGLLVKEQTTHQALRERGKRKDGTESEKTVISPEVVKQYSNFLTGYVRNMNRLNTENGATLDLPAFRHERELMGMLSSGGEPDPNKIKAFVESHQGLALTTQLLEEQTSLMLFALGLDASPRFGGKGIHGRNFEQQPTGPALVNVGKSGIMREGVGRLAHIAGTDTMGAARGLGGLAIGGGLGAMYGYNLDHRMVHNIANGIQQFVISTGANAASPVVIGALGAGVGLGVARRFFLPDGDVDLNVCGEGLRVLQGDPRMVRYVHQMTGVNANDFMVVNGRVERNPNQPEMETANIKDIKRQIAQNIHTRRAFYESIGYPTTRKGRGFEQLFTGPNRDERQQWATRWSERVNTLLDRNGAAYQAMTPQQQREAYMEVRRQVMQEYMQDYRDKVLRGGDRSGVESELKGKKSKLSEADKLAHQERHGELERRAKEDREELERVHKEIYDPKPLEEGQVSKEQALLELDEARKKLRDIDPSLSLADVETTYIPELLKKRRASEAAVQKLRNELAKEQREVRRGVDSKGNPKDLSRYTKTVTTGKTVSNVPMTQEEIYQLLQRDYDTQVSRYADEIREIDSKVTLTRSVAKGIDDKEEQLKKANETQSAPFIQESREALQDILTAASGLTPPVTEADLADVSITIDQLLQRINRAHRVRHTGQSNEPWTEAENARSELRQRLLKARVEAGVRQAMQGYLPDAEASLQAVMGLAGFPTLIPEAKLAQMDPASLRAMWMQLYTANPTGFPAPIFMSNESMQLAIDAAKARRDFRKDVVDNMIKGLRKTETQESWIKDHYQEPESVQQLDVTLQLIERQGEILSNTTDPERFTMADIVNPDVAQRADDDLNDSEKATIRQIGGVPRGYYQIVNFLFDHKAQSDGNAEFDKIRTILNPRSFFEMVTEGLDTGELVLEGVGGLVMPANIRDLFTQMQTSYQDAQLNERGMRRLSMYIIDRLVEQGRNIT